MVPSAAFVGVADGAVAPAGCAGWIGSCSPNAPVIKVLMSAPSALTVANTSPWMFGRL